MPGRCQPHKQPLRRRLVSSLSEISGRDHPFRSRSKHFRRPIDQGGISTLPFRDGVPEAGDRDWRACIGEVCLPNARPLLSPPTAPAALIDVNGDRRFENGMHRGCRRQREGERHQVGCKFCLNPRSPGCQVGTFLIANLSSILALAILPRSHHQSVVIHSFALGIRHNGSATGASHRACPHGDWGDVDGDFHRWVVRLDTSMGSILNRAGRHRLGRRFHGHQLGKGHLNQTIEFARYPVRQR